MLGDVVMGDEVTFSVKTSAEKDLVDIKDRDADAFDFGLVRRVLRLGHGVSCRLRDFEVNRHEEGVGILSTGGSRSRGDVEAS